MTWTLALYQDTTDGHQAVGSMALNIQDEEVPEYRDAILRILARPVFEREEQTKRLFEMAMERDQAAEAAIEAARHEDWTEEPKADTKPHRAKRGAFRAWDVTRDDLLNIMRHVHERHGAGLDAKALTQSVNARRVERGELPISVSSVRSTANLLVDQGRLVRTSAPSGRASHRLVWAWAEQEFACTVDQDRGVIAGSAS